MLKRTTHFVFQEGGGEERGDKRRRAGKIRHIRQEFGDLCHWMWSLYPIDKSLVFYKAKEGRHVRMCDIQYHHWMFARFYVRVHMWTVLALPHISLRGEV
jgi:hypothetical protein